MIQYNVDGLGPAEAQLIRLLDTAWSHVYVLSQVGDDTLPHLRGSIRSRWTHKHNLISIDQRSEHANIIILVSSIPASWPEHFTVNSLHFRVSIKSLDSMLIIVTCLPCFEAYSYTLRYSFEFFTGSCNYYCLIRKPRQTGDPTPGPLNWFGSVTVSV